MLLIGTEVSVDIQTAVGNQTEAIMTGIDETLIVVCLSFESPRLHKDRCNSTGTQDHAALFVVLWIYSMNVYVCVCVCVCVFTWEGYACVCVI
jgi:hypothetical protein